MPFFCSEFLRTQYKMMQQLLNTDPFEIITGIIIVYDIFNEWHANKSEKNKYNC